MCRQQDKIKFNFKLKGLLGVNIWSSDRNKQPWINFPQFTNPLSKRHFYHPVKWSHLVEKKETQIVRNFTQFLCNSVLPHLHKPNNFTDDIT